jgi:hypothetical protein
MKYQDLMKILALIKDQNQFLVDLENPVLFVQLRGKDLMMKLLYLIKLKKIMEELQLQNINIGLRQGVVKE